MKSIESKVLMAIRSIRRGELFFPEDFSRLGSPEAIRLALHRLGREKVITRIAQGIYVRPKESKYLGPILPSAEMVAEAIAKRDRVRTVPTGSYALNALGLSSQLPMKIVMLTDGSPREIKVGNRTIRFKRTTPKNLMAKGRISRLVIQALKEIGAGNMKASEELKIIELLRNEDPSDLTHDIQLAPIWIQKVMKKAL